jgi:acyl carrier protein
VTEDPMMTALAGCVRRVFRKPDLALGRESWSQDIDGWDSFKLIEILLECQATFGTTLLPEEMDRVESLGDIADRLRAHLAADQALPPS